MVERKPSLPLRRTPREGAANEDLPPRAVAAGRLTERFRVVEESDEDG